LASSTHLPVVYGEIAELIVSILDSITNREPIDGIIANLMTIQTYLASDVKLAEVISQIQITIIGILQNIIDRVSMTFVMGRFDYLRELLAEAKTL
jgi:hypothetical protein